MNHKILLVDDDIQFGQQVRQVCTDQKLDLSVANSTSQAIDLAWSELPSIIIISVEVAKNSGYGLCSALKRNPKLSKIPVVIISSNASKSEFDRHTTLKGRAELYFSKSTSIALLVSSLLPILTLPRDQFLDSISKIQADKPILKTPTPSAMFWIAIACLLVITIFWLVSLH